MTVHAHPDDESSKGPSSVARYHDEGIETVLVCCTGGEQGDILNPAMEHEDIRANLPEVRLRELEAATKVIGYDHVELLGYRDSGMAGEDSNNDPRCFARAPIEEASRKLASLIRKYRPHVVVTYGDDQSFYPHPDHLKVHDVTIAAWAVAGNPSMHPEDGSSWQPSKLYYSEFSMAKFKIMRDAMRSMGVELPFPDDQALSDIDARITTTVDVAAWMHIRADALRAHATQIDPQSPMWLGMPEEKERLFAGTDHYILAESSVETSLPEDDLFAGLRKSPSQP